MFPTNTRLFVLFTSNVGEINTLISPTLKRVSDNADLNNFPTEFPYVLSIITTTGKVTNSPTGYTGIIIQLCFDSNSIVQIFFGVACIGCWKRAYNSGTWSNWIQFIS